MRDAQLHPRPPKVRGFLTRHGSGLHVPRNIAPALIWMFITPVIVLKPPQKAFSEGSGDWIVLESTDGFRSLGNDGH